MVMFNSAAILCMSAWINHHDFTVDALDVLRDLQERFYGKTSTNKSIHPFYVLLESWTGLLSSLRRQYARLHIKVESCFGDSHEAFILETLSSVFKVFADFTLHTQKKGEHGTNAPIDLLITNNLNPNVDDDEVAHILRLRDNFLSSNALFEVGHMIRTIYDKENRLTVDLETFASLFCRFQDMENRLGICD